MLYCSYCDAQYPKWQGQCEQCGKWGTVAQEESTGEQATPVKASPIKTLGTIDRTKTDMVEVDTVLGGGFVAGSLTLLAGDPGVGKSTLVLQMASGFSKHTKGTLLYICGEESPEQISMRIKRLGLVYADIQFITDTRSEAIVSAIGIYKPSLVVVDSIQTMRDDDVAGEAGSVSAVRTSTSKLLQVAKTNHTPIIIIGHVTKEGSIAGPRMLEHMVDVVLYVEGDNVHQYRLLRSTKNRFGPTDQVGVFSMTEKGLEEVQNPSQLFLSQQPNRVAGSVVTVLLDGIRPFLIEIQALTNKTSFGYPKRTASGFSTSRLELLLAILSRRAGLQLADQDVYVNVVGGLRANDPGLDAAAAIAVASSISNQPLSEKVIVLGELGLGGEVRPVTHLEHRLKEASRLGFNRALVPAQKKLTIDGITLEYTNTLTDILSAIGVQK